MSSSGKVLDMSQIHSLMAHSETTTQTIAKWPGEDNLLRLAKAVKAQSPVVLFKNGVRFDIKYCGQIFRTISDDVHESVFIKPSTGKESVPCGYISMRQLSNILPDEDKGVE